MGKTHGKLNYLVINQTNWQTDTRLIIIMPIGKG